MSLALFQGRIDAGDVDEAVRAHLRGCDECRAHYDTLALAASALGDDGAARERERLLSALPLPQRGEGRGEGSGRWFVAVGAAVAAGFFAFVVMTPVTSQPDVGLRGTANPAEAPFSLRVYGKDAPGQPVHLIADFPGSREAAVGMRAELQYFAVAPKPDLVLVVETRGGGRTVRGQSKPATKEELVPVGEPFSIGGFGPGTTQVCAVLAAAGHGASPASSIDDLKRSGLAASEVFCSTLQVSP